MQLWEECLPGRVSGAMLYFAPYGGPLVRLSLTRAITLLGASGIVPQSHGWIEVFNAMLNFRRPPTAILNPACSTMGMDTGVR
jgi:hypothetical protein